VQASVQIAGAKAQSDVAKNAQDNSLEWRKAQLQALTQIEVARIGAKTDADSSALAARLEAILGFAGMTHEAMQADQDRLHEGQENAADRAHEQDLAAQQAQQAPQESV